MDWNWKLFGVVPGWALLVLGIGLILFTFRGPLLRSVYRIVRRIPWIIPLGLIVALAGIFWPAIFHWWKKGGGVTVERSIAIIVPCLVVTIGTLFIWLRRCSLTPEGPDGEVKENNLFVRLLQGNPTRGGIHISQIGLWTWVFGLSLAVFATGWIPNGSLWMKISLEVVVLVLLALFFKRQLRSITGNPPHRAVYLFADARTKTEFGEGWVWLFPGLESLAPVNMTKRDYNIKVPDIRTSDQAQMEGSFQMPWTPDGDNLGVFIAAGGEQGVQNLAEEYALERIREFYLHHVIARAAHRKVMRPKANGTGYAIEDEEYLMEPWEASQHLKNKLILRLILEMIDLDGLDTEDRKVADAAAEYIRTHTETDDEDVRKEALKSINGAADKIRNILRKKGCPDRFHWGIRILDINVGTILPAGKTKEAADLRAKETAERQAEIFETETEALQTARFQQELTRLGVTVGFMDAYRILMDYKMTKAGHGFAVPGVAGPLAASIGTILARFAGGSK